MVDAERACTKSVRGIRNVDSFKECLDFHGNIY